jgi:hypothetical protein
MSSLRQTRKTLIPILLIMILAVSMVAAYVSYSTGNKAEPDPGSYIGVAFSGNTTQDAKLLIDKIKSYTNLFVFATGRNPISTNQTSIEEIGDYAVSNGLSVILNLGWRDYNVSKQSWFWLQPSLEPIRKNWTQRWGDKFLGVYYNDEIGGVQLDSNWNEFFKLNAPLMPTIDDIRIEHMYQVYLKMLDSQVNGTKPTNYDLEASFFTNDCVRGDLGLDILDKTGFRTFTSDYGLYWWNYLGGYQVMFAELGWNNSAIEQIALVKGAAHLQNKEWGTIITWKYDQAPYLDTGEVIYSQMLTSYEVGSKYIVVFDYPYVQGNDYGVLTDGHFLAMQRFWNDIINGKFIDRRALDTALVLPHNYGWGLRSPNDTIWGFWPPDDKSPQIGLAVGILLAKYGTNLDIVFEDSAFPVSNGHYKQVYYWNQTIS